MNNNLLIVGTSTTARSVFKFVMDYNLYHIIGFVVDEQYKTNEVYCDYPVYDFNTLPKDFDKARDYLFIAMEWDRLNATRRKLYERFKKEGFNLANIISPHAIIHGDLIGDNCWICDNVVIENDAVIHNDVFVKTAALIHHLSIVDSHCFIGARSQMAGSVHVGEQTYIGIGAVIFNGVNIGRKCLVGGATYVKRHLPDFSIIKTRNDEFVIKTYDENEIENKLLAAVKIR